GAGTILAAGTNITATQTIYIYAQTGDANVTCTNESSFVVTVNQTPVLAPIPNVTACLEYTLPALTTGNYFTQPNGQGTALFAGDVITQTQTLYVFAQTNTVPNCTNEVSFTVTIVDTPPINTPSTLEVCDDNNDGFATFNLTLATNQITGGNPWIVTFHETETDAAFGVNAITQPAQYTNIVANLQTIYVRVVEV
ncbi:hypothetical protein V6O07_05780, partial [Arthrospira platensis SPKY2]